MKVILFIFALVSIGSSGIIDDIFNVPDSVLAQIPLTMPVGEICNDVKFNYCQVEFNRGLNIDTSLTWRNGTALLTAIKKAILANGTDIGLIGTCRVRKQFFGCLGDTYSACVNNYHLISEMSSTDKIRDAYRYTGMFKELDFVCNGGFEIAIAEYGTIITLDTSTNAIQCMQNFDSSLTGQPTQICKAGGAYATCLQNYFNSQLGLIEGWWACEKTRVAFADQCSNIKCLVTSTPSN
uniref:DUF19 domain-containing protein n=1 Tax=Strongyloides papillosus TaxID=174720 RepID=A0A0N5C6J3_STREA